MQHARKLFLVLCLLTGSSSGIATAGGSDENAQEKLQELNHAMNLAASKGQFLAAHRLASEALVLCSRVLGKRHWKTGDVQREADRWRALADLSVDQQREAGRVLTLLAQGRAGSRRAFVEALAHSRRHLGERHALTASCLTYLGNHHDGLGEYHAALRLHGQSLALRRDVLGEDHIDTATSYSNLAITLTDLGQDLRAAPLHDRALAIRLHVLGEEHPRTAIGYYHLGASLHARGQSSRALPMLETALRIRERTLGENHPQTATACNELATVLEALARSLEAEKLRRRALAIARATVSEDHPLLAGCLCNLGVNLEGQGMLREGQRLHEQALALNLQQRGETHPDTARSYGLLGLNLTSQGRLVEGQHLLQHSLTLQQRVLGNDHPDTGAAHNNLGVNLHAQGKTAEARRAFTLALNIALGRHGEDHPLTATRLANLGNTLLAAGEVAQAREMLYRARVIREKTLGPNHPLTAQSYEHLGGLLLEQGHYAEARQMYERARTIQEKRCGKNHPDIAVCLNHIGGVLLRQGDIEAARIELERAWQQNRKILGEEHPRTGESIQHVALAWWLLGKHSEAIHLWQATLPTLEAMPYREATTGFDRANGPSHAQNCGLALAVGLASKGQPNNAFAHLESALARGLLDDLGGALTSRLRHLDEQLVLHATAMTGTAGYSRYQELSRQRREVLTRLRAERAERSLQATASREQIQSALPADAALVYYVELPVLGQHAVCVLRREGEPAWRTLSPAGYSLAREVARNLPHKEDDQRKRIEALGRERLEPIRPLLGATGNLPAVKRLFVVPVGWLAHVPLEVLTAEFTVSYVPSGSILAYSAREHRPLRSDGLLAVGDPAFADPRRRLPGSRIEVEMLARLVPDARVLLRSEASEQTLDRLRQTGEMASFRIIHIATHGASDARLPEQSKLFLAADHLPEALESIRRGGKIYTGALTVQTIREEWKLDADMVVLSACQTGLGKATVAEGQLGFAHAFLSRGARSVVLSRWKVDDTATALLMLRFYENLLGKRPGSKVRLGRAEALDEAKRWLRSLSRADVDRLGSGLTRGELRGTVTDLPATPLVKPARVPGERPFAHPFYWAAFVLVGDPD